MDVRLRLTCATLAAAMAAATSLAAGPAQAEGTHYSFTKHTTKRTFTRTVTGSSGRLSASSTATTPVNRIAGTDRIDTAIQASQAAWDDAGTSSGNVAGAVILTRFDEYADALGGSALAGAAAGPLLMTPPTTLDGGVKAEIDRVLGGAGTIYVLGGTGAISADVAAGLTSAGYTVVRLAGADRYDTSVAIAEKVGDFLPPAGNPQFVFATTGLNFPDGLAAGATAGGYSATVVLTRDNTLTQSVDGYLARMHTNGVPELAVGGAAAGVARAWDGEIVGADRYETAALVAEGFWADPSTPDDDPDAVGLATGLNWPDALSGGAFMAGGGPLVLTQTDALPAATGQAVQDMVASATPSPVQAGFVFGGTSVVGTTPEQEFSALLG
jgi:hypothetical protein